MKRRALLAAATAAASTTVAGCNSFLDDDDADATTSDRPTPQFSTVDGSDRERGQPEQVDHEHLVVVRNDDDTSHRVRITVHDRRMDVSTYTWGSTIEPGHDDPIYDVEHADPTGVQSYEIGIEVEDRTASTVLWTNQCYGDATLAITADGDLTASVDTC